MDSPVLVNESSMLPCPYNTKGPSHSMDGRIIENYNIGPQGSSVCIGNGTQWLKIIPQVWWFIVNTTKANWTR